MCTRERFCLCSFSLIFTSKPHISHVDMYPQRHALAYKYTSWHSYTQRHKCTCRSLCRPSHVHTDCQFPVETGVLPAVLLWLGDNRRLQSQVSSQSFPQGPWREPLWGGGWEGVTHITLTIGHARGVRIGSGGCMWHWLLYSNRSQKVVRPYDTTFTAAN